MIFLVVTLDKKRAMNYHINLISEIILIMVCSF
jgi:hypothetical protein